MYMYTLQVGLSLIYTMLYFRFLYILDSCAMYIEVEVCEQGQ